MIINFLFILSIQCLKIPLHNFSDESLPFAIKPILTDKITAAKSGFYGKYNYDETEE